MGRSTSAQLVTYLLTKYSTNFICFDRDFTLGTLYLLGKLFIGSAALLTLDNLKIMEGHLFAPGSEW